MSIIKGLFIGLKNLKVVPFNRMTPELHDELGSNLAKVMLAAKMSDAKLTKAQREYVVNQAKQLQEFEDRYITGIKDKSGNVIKSDEGIKDTKSARIFNIQGEKLDPSKPIIGGTQQGKKINREFFSRDAERKDDIRKGIAKEVQQRIDSGVAATVEKMLAMKPIDAMKEANRVIKREGPYKNLTQQDAKKILQDTEDHIFERNIKPKETDMDFDDDGFADGGRIGFFKGAQADTKKGKSMSPGTDTKGNVRDDNPFTGGGGDTPTDDDKTFIEPPKVDIKNIRENPYLNLNTPMGVASLSPAILARIARMGKKIKPILGGDVGLEYADEVGDTTTNFKIIQDIEDLIKEKKLNPELKYKKEIGDNTLIEGGLDAGGDFNIFLKKKFADGGRIGFKKGMDRRTFMKIMTGLASIPVVGKVFKGAKLATKAAPVAEKAAAASSGQPPAYFFNLVNKIKNLGDDVTKKQAIKEREIVTEYKDYKLTEDLDTGEIQISKTKLGYDERFDEGIISEEYMSFKPGQADETTRGKKVVDEYEENTVYVDKDGKIRDVEEGVSEETIQEGTVFEDNITDFETKKADGGRIGLFAGSLKGGGILRTIIKNLAKEKGVSPSEYLRVANYKALPDSAKRFMSEAEFLKLKETMTGKRIKMVENFRDMISSRLAFDKSKADLAASMNKASPGYGDQAVKMMFPEGSFKSPVPAGAGEKDIMMMEQLIKNLQTKGRKENASGGIARMLGE